jgi:murein DD-endopeptidase MepM/ murein hydrolase activator NlpD
MAPRTRAARPSLRARARGALAALVVGVLAATLGLGATGTAVADEWDDRRAAAEARAKAAEEAAARLAEELEGAEAALVQAVIELEGINAAIPVAEAQLAAAEAELARLQREAEIIAQQLAAAEALERQIAADIEADTQRAEAIRVAIGRMAREAYRGDMAASTLSAVLDAESTDEFLQQSELAETALRTQTQALQELEQITAANRNRQVRQEAVREEIADLKAQADAKVAEAEVARQAAEAHRAELEQLRVEAEEKKAYIEARRAQLEAQAAEAQRQAQQLAADLAEVIRQQEEARRKAGQNPVGSTADRPFINPTSINPIYKTSDYGMRLHPILGYVRLHSGTDLRTYCNTPIYAGASGTVQWAKFRSGYGNQVLVNHGYWKGSSLMSSYNHLSSYVVGPGQNVSQGQLIGYSGNTGTSAGCHLHFEVYVNGATVDPWPLIAK